MTTHTLVLTETAVDLWTALPLASGTRYFLQNVSVDRRVFFAEAVAAPAGRVGHVVAPGEGATVEQPTAAGEVFWVWSEGRDDATIAVTEAP